MKLVLASSSPRRKQLLADAGYAFDVVPPDEHVEKISVTLLSPVEVVRVLAWKKAADVASRTASGIVVAADTVAECDGKVLGKPRDRSHAREILEQLGGREHFVHTGVCVWPRPGEKYQLRSCTTALFMKPWRPEILEAWLDSGDWEGKAGAFGYQDGLDWVKILSGSESNVVGLPMELLTEMLESLKRGLREMNVPRPSKDFP
jgi:septum formation protein